MQDFNKSRLEMGGDLHTLANIAKDWFTTNNIEIPKHSKVWGKLSVRRGEIRPVITYLLSTMKQQHGSYKFLI